MTSIGKKEVPPHILDKLKRCLAMTTDRGAWENEASVAMKIATKIMEEYGLSQADVEMDMSGHVRKEAYKEEYGYTCRDIWPWERTLGHVVDNLFPVKFFVRTATGIVFVGAASDAGIAAAVYKILRSELLRISKSEPSPALRRSFLTGCTDILLRRAGELWKAKQEPQVFTGSVDAGKALVVVKEKDLKEYVKKTYNLHNIRARGSAHYDGAYSRGAQAGENVNLNFNKAIGQ
jgi:hypothetical protein